MKRNSNDTSVDEARSVKQKVQRKWLPEEEAAILRYLLNTVTVGRVVEKPTAYLYYKKMQDQLLIPNCSNSQLKNKVKNLKKTYIDVIAWRTQIGPRVLEIEGEDTYTAITLKKCPNFEILDKIFGGRLNLYPLCVVSSCFSTVPITPKEEPEFVTHEEDDVPSLDLTPDNSIIDNAEHAEDLTQMEDIAQMENNEQTEDIVVAPDINSAADICGAATPVPKKRGPRSVAAVSLLAEARNKKIELDRERLDLDKKKFEFEKEKFQFEKDKVEREIELEKLRIENQYKLSKYEMELKYGKNRNLSES